MNDITEDKRSIARQIGWFSCMSSRHTLAPVGQWVALLLAVAIGPLAAEVADAASLNVLWYGQNPIYDGKMSEFAAQASTYDPWGDGSLTWNLTIWNPTDPAPNFADYDVLAIGTGGNAWNFSFDPTGIFSNKEAISAARGSRTFLSGQDADAHYILGAGTRPGTSADGPLGFLVNAVNWAGSGTGMGIVALTDGWTPSPSPYNRRWWLDDRSFLKAELDGYVSYFLEESVVIPTSTAQFPVNEGLTTPGLSNWYQSAHAAFHKNIPGYISINDAGTHPGYAVTMVTASEANGSTQKPRKKSVPEPSIIFGLLGVLTFTARRKVQRRK